MPLPLPAAKAKTTAMTNDRGASIRQRMHAPPNHKIWLRNSLVRSFRGLVKNWSGVPSSTIWP